MSMTKPLLLIFIFSFLGFSMLGNKKPVGSILSYNPKIVKIIKTVKKDY